MTLSFNKMGQPRIPVIELNNIGRMQHQHSQTRMNGRQKVLTSPMAYYMSNSLNDTVYEGRMDKVTEDELKIKIEEMF